MEYRRSVVQFSAHLFLVFRFMCRECNINALIINTDKLLQTKEDTRDVSIALQRKRLLEMNHNIRTKSPTMQDMQ